MAARSDGGREATESAPLLPATTHGRRRARVKRRPGNFCGCKPSTWYLFDLGVLSCGVMLTFVGYVGAQQILTTVFPSIGSLSLGIIYSCFAVGCLVSPAVVATLGHKASVGLQLLLLSLWIASSLKPSVELAVPASVLAGFFAAAFWTAVPTYLSNASKLYDEAVAIEAGDPFPPPTLKAQEATTDLPSDEVAVAPPTVVQNLAATLRIMASRRELQLMIPLFFYVGIEQAFFFSVFGSRLVSPVFGDGMVGFTSIGFGVTNVVSSLALGHSADRFGWAVPLAVGMLAQTCALALLIAWQVADVLVIEDDAVGVGLMYAVSGAWGIGDAAFNAVIATMIGNFFPTGGRGNETEAAFATMRLFSAMVCGLCFFGMPPLREHTSERTSMAVELLVPLGMIVAAVIGLAALHARTRQDSGAETAGVRPSVVEPSAAARRNTQGLFQGVFFSVFMTTFISGDLLSGVLLGSGKHPPRRGVVDLFLVYTAFGICGFLVITLFLRRHTVDAGPRGELAVN